MSNQNELETSVKHLSMIANQLLRVVSLQDAIITDHGMHSSDPDQIATWQREVDELLKQLPIHFPSADDGWQWNQPGEETT